MRSDFQVLFPARLPLKSQRDRFPVFGDRHGHIPPVSGGGHDQWHPYRWRALREIRRQEPTAFFRGIHPRSSIATCQGVFFEA